MFFTLSKILAYLTYPFFWIIGLVIFAYFTKNDKSRKRALVGAAAIFLFFSNSVIFDEFMRHWEVPGQTYEGVGEYDVGIVLTGMASYDNTHERLVFQDGSDRIWQAVKLYQLGKLKKILITGDSGNLLEDGLDEAVQLKEYLVGLGLPANDIIVEAKSRSTHENARYTASLLKKNYPEFDSFLLITSAFHMRRAQACFEAQNLAVDAFPVDYVTGKRWFTMERLFIPNMSVMSQWRILTHEWAGYAMYGLMGYL